MKLFSLLQFWKIWLF